MTKPVGAAGPWGAAGAVGVVRGLGRKVREDNVSLLSAGVATGQERTLTWADGTDVVTLDGAFTIDISSTTLLRHVAETLVRLNAALAIEPGLAESWSVAKDGVTWTFRLRRGARFSSGTLVTAQAVKFNLERILDPKTAAANRAAFASIVSVDVVDERTLKIVTKQPFPDLLRALADRAAVAGISASVPFPPLPAEFKGSEVRLQFAFVYNMK